MLSLESARAAIRQNLAPILLLDTLSPSQASILPGTRWVGA